MEDYKQMLAELLAEEEELQFTTFTNETAYQIGCQIADQARHEKKSITIDITRNGQQLFHCALSGRTLDSSDWVKRKTNIVHRFGHSSYYVGLQLKSKQKTIQERYSLDPANYAASGGAFPIIVRNVGMIGCIAVSGLTQEEDHQIVTSAIRDYLMNSKDYI